MNATVFDIDNQREESRKRGYEYQKKLNQQMREAFKTFEKSLLSIGRDAPDKGKVYDIDVFKVLVFFQQEMRNKVFWEECNAVRPSTKFNKEKV